MNIWVINASYCRVMKNQYDWNYLYKLLSYSTTFKDRLGRLTNATQSYFNRRNGSFGLGFLNHITKALDKDEIEYNIEYKEKPFKIPKLQMKEIKFSGITLEEYQKNASEVPFKFQRGIIQSPTGSGKGIIGASLIRRLNNISTLIIVPTTSIMHGFTKELNNTLKLPIGNLGDSIDVTENITVGLYQSIIKKDVKWLNQFKMVIVDEAHGAGNNSINTILDKMEHTWYRYGLSATPISKKNKKEWFAVTSQLGEVILKVQDEEVSERVTAVDVIMLKIFTDPEHNKYMDIYRHDILLNKERNKLIVKAIDLAMKNKKNCLIIVDEYEQAKQIQNLMKRKVEIAWSGNKDIKELQVRFNTYKVPIVIATPVWGVGTNIPNIESLILGSCRKSSINTLQKIGRGRRKTKDKGNLLLIDIYDVVSGITGEKYFTRYSEKRKNLYQMKGWTVKIKEI